MVKRNKCYRPQLVMPQTFEQCFTYEKQVLFLKNEIDKLKTQVDTSKIEQRLALVEANLAMLSSEVAEINVDEIKAQLQTINAELTELKNTSSAQADTITALQTTVAGKQNALTFDSTPTAGSSNPVTSDGIRTAIDEAGGGTSTVEWVETNMDDFIASLPDNVTYTTDINTNDINGSTSALVPNNMIKGTFTRTGMFISSDKRYLKVVYNVTNITVHLSSPDTTYTGHLKSIKCPFTYCAYYVTIREEGGNFTYINDFYSSKRSGANVYFDAVCSKVGDFNANGVFTCNVYFKLKPELPIDLM